MDATNQIISNVWKTAIFLLFFLFLARSVNAQVQNGWTPNDSVRLTKMLKGEMPIHIDDAFKRELEQSIIGHSPKDDKRYWDDFRLDIDFKEDFPNVVNIECATTFHYKLNHNNNLLNGNLKCKSLMINSRIDKNLPLIKIQQKTNMTIPLNKKLHFSVYGSYTLDKKRSVILPATSIPYKVGAGFSYEIGKHAIIKSQTNYQYNIIQKKWEWFFGAGVFFTF